jgi:hypothetical protein
VVYVYETYTDEEALEVHKNNEPFKKFDEILQYELLEEWGRLSFSRRALHPTSTSDLGEPAPNATTPRSAHRI